MKGNWKKYLTSGLILSASTVLLAACGNGKTDTSEPNTAGDDSTEEVKVEGNVKVWIDTEHIDTFKGIVADFEKEYPDVKVEIAAGSSADAKKDVAKDPKAAADVFMMPHDQLGQMAEAGLIYPNTKYAEEVKANNVDSAIEGATWAGELYGYPYGVESQILYYNTSTLSEDDVKTWTGLTSAGKIGTNFAEAGANYIFGPLFMSNGLYLYGESGEDPEGTNFNSEPGVEVLKWVAAQKNNPGVVQSGAEALANLESGVSDAFLSGPWSKNDVEKALGDNMGVAAYPTIDFGNGEVQMKAFLGVKLFAVNQQTEAPLAAMALANFLSNESSQLVEFEKMGVIPSNKNLQSNEEVLSDDVAKAVMEMSQTTHSVVMPKIPEMVSFWPAVDAVLNDTYKGNIKEADFMSKLDALVKDTAKVSE
ncbi:extracellular solute-binding protein [Enterococcus lemanii]|uniref:Extracellular solute-binding protein n=1 Tax=Enterococcus lemanii TaxID=1159752 RepID=A0ABV9MSB7_9ENTE|nr:extracellular solute-binding protein [Enterococcus lemanii]MBM7710045.1 arabinogalactan oligomer/maltooligosaccharide transport system substrate-binding protein [Enterococcus lemanii]